MKTREIKILITEEEYGDCVKYGTPLDLPVSRYIEWVLASHMQSINTTNRILSKRMAKQIGRLYAKG